MAYTQTGVVNMALIHLGVDVISDIDSTTEEQARKAKAVWEMLFYTVLEAVDWTFAKKTVELAKDSTAPVNEDEWAYRYALPADYVRLIKKGLSFGDAQPYEIRAGYIYTDWDNDNDPLYITYVRKLALAEINLCSATFCVALSYLLASMLAARLSKATRNEMIEKYLVFKGEAEGIDATGYGMVEEEEGSNSWASAGR